MDKEFVEKYNLTEAVKRINEINNYRTPRVSLREYAYITELDEDGEQDQQQNMPPQDNGMGQQDMNMQQPMGQPMDGGMQDISQQQGMPMDNGQQMPQQPQMGGEQMPPMDNGGMQDMGQEMPPMEGEMPMDDGIETEEMEPEDEVIDVDELTQSQEATEYKVDGVNDKIASMMDLFNKMVDGLKANSDKIEALKDEFEKRNPTEEERLNIRSQSSYPYSETPKDYWNQKMEDNPHYNVMYNNDISPEEEQKEFEIKKDDIDGLDMKSISDSLNYKPNLNDYLQF